MLKARIRSAVVALLFCASTGHAAILLPAAQIETSAGLFSAITSLISAIFGISGQKTPTNTVSNPSSTASPPKPKPAPTAEALGVKTGSEDVAHGEASAPLTLFGEECKTVVNQRTDDNLPVMVPTTTKAEWDSFQAHPPSGVSVGSCSCDIDMKAGEVYQKVSKALGYDLIAKYTALPPMAGTYVDINSQPATVNHICSMLGCKGSAKVLSTRSYSSPDNNVLIRWDSASSDWVKFPASESNIKLGCKGDCPVLRCPSI